MGTYDQPAIIDEAEGMRQANAEISKFNNNVKVMGKKLIDAEANKAIPLTSKKK